jgi:hypothetical protein
MTYTTLKNTLPMLKLYSKLLSEKMDLYPFQASAFESEALALEAAAQAESRGEKVDEVVPVKNEDKTESRTMRIFFPDMGAAVVCCILVFLLFFPFLKRFEHKNKKS